jgi:hypothetical protein
MQDLTSRGFTTWDVNPAFCTRHDVEELFEFGVFKCLDRLRA